MKQQLRRLLGVERHSVREDRLYGAGGICWAFGLAFSIASVGLPLWTTGVAFALLGLGLGLLWLAL